MNREHFHNRYKYDNREHKIGGGAFGTVYKAYDRNRDREVAVKVQEVKDIEGKEFSLQLEYDAIKALEDHPNIANYESVWRYEDGPGIYDYAIMQFYPLGNLSNYLKNSSVSSEEQNKILVQILQGIAYLHQNKVVHRDIKPGNILVVNRPGEGIIPKITDFGLSKLAEIKDDYSQFQNSFAGGTVEYSSPEQLKGLPLKFNTDLWSFGVIIFEVFTGKILFEVEGYGQGSAGKQGEIMQQIFKKDILEDLKKLPEEWRNIAQLCLERDQDKRPANGKELLKKLPKEYYDLKSDLFLNKKQTQKFNTQEVNLDNDDETIILQNKVYDDDKETVVHIQGNDTDTELSTDENLKEDIGKKPRTKNRKPYIIGIGALVLVGFLVFGAIKFIVKSSDPEFMAMVQLNGKTGYIDSQGNSVIEPIYLGGSSFSEGLAPIRTTNGWNFINPSGKIVIQENYDLATAFSDGFALVQKNEQWFFINKNGENLFKETFMDANIFSDGFAPVKRESKTVFIDKTGNNVFDTEYESAFSFSDGLAPVKNREKWGFIDKTGKLIIDYKYLATKDFIGNVAAVKKGDQWIFIDKNDQELFDISFDNAGNFSNGLVAVKQNNKWGFIDKEGKIIIDFKYDSAGGFVNDMAPVKIKNEWMFIDKKENQVIDSKYEMVDNFSKVN